MAEAQAEVCVACAQPVPVTSNRRRFRSASSSHVLPTLSEIIGRLDSAASSAILDPQGPAFVCRGCFSSLEKLKKVSYRYISLLEVRHRLLAKNMVKKRNVRFLYG